jgi:hypothetical protein
MSLQPGRGRCLFCLFACLSIENRSTKRTIVSMLKIVWGAQGWRMARQPRSLFPWALYHCISRGHQRKQLFLILSGMRACLCLVQCCANFFGLSVKIFLALTGSRSALGDIRVEDHRTGGRAPGNDRHARVGSEAASAEFSFFSSNALGRGEGIDSAVKREYATVINYGMWLARSFVACKILILETMRRA